MAQPESVTPGTSCPGSIFISYRRSDSITETGRIYDRLVEAFGEERVFKDVDDIPLGADFVDVLEQAVSQAAVLIAVIGPTWLTVTDAEGRRRLEDPQDFVAIEVAAALNRDILVLPILVKGAKFPDFKELPSTIRPLARRNAAQARHDPDFHSDMDRVVAKLQDYFDQLGIPAPAPAPKATARTGVPLPAVLSGVCGFLALVDGVAVLADGATDGAALSLSVGIMLVVAAGLLLSRTAVGWVVGVAAQVVALVLCGKVVYESWLYDEFSIDALFVLVPVISLVTLVCLLLPAARRGVG